MLKLKRISKEEFFNIDTLCRNITVYLYFFNIKLIPLKHYFIIIKSQYRKNLELQNEEYREEQRKYLNYYYAKRNNK